MPTGRGAIRLLAAQLIAGALAGMIGVGAGHAQGTPLSVLSPCKDLSLTSVATIAGGLAGIEQAVAAKHKALEALKAPPAPAPGAAAIRKVEREKARAEITALEERLQAGLKKALTDKRKAHKALSVPAEREKVGREIEALEQSLVDAVYRIECLRTEEEGVRSKATGKIVDVTGWYATNRTPTGRTGPEDFYGNKDAASLQYGKFTVSIPATHTEGNIEEQFWLWRLFSSPDPAQHFVIKGLTPLADKAALTELSEAVGKAKTKALLLFVHGFNNSFADAARRTAQLTYDLKFPGIPMFMSWPATKSYTHDIQSVKIAETALEILLADIAKLPFEEVYILAHSMGNELVTRVLADRQKAGSDLRTITELLLAAPDISAEVFKTQIAPVLGRLTKTRKTIYASANDVALKAAKGVVDGYVRVGDTSGGVQVYAGFETIDSTKAAPLYRAFGHSYVFDSRPVLGDLRSLLGRPKDAIERALKRKDEYWLLE